METSEILLSLVLSILGSLLAARLTKMKIGTLLRYQSFLGRLLITIVESWMMILYTIMSIVKNRLIETADTLVEDLKDFLNTSVKRIIVIRQLASVMFSTLVGALSWCFVMFGFLISCSYGTELNDRTIGECGIGFMFCLCSAWLINVVFHKLINYPVKLNQTTYVR